MSISSVYISLVIWYPWANALANRIALLSATMTIAPRFLKLSAILDPTLP